MCRLASARLRQRHRPHAPRPDWPAPFRDRCPSQRRRNKWQSDRRTRFRRIPGKSYRRCRSSWWRTRRRYRREFPTAVHALSPRRAAPRSDASPAYRGFRACGSTRRMCSPPGSGCRLRGHCGDGIRSGRAAGPCRSRRPALQARSWSVWCRNNASSRPSRRASGTHTSSDQPSGHSKCRARRERSTDATWAEKLARPPPSNAWSAANPTILPVARSTPICVRILKACRLIPN